MPELHSKKSVPAPAGAYTLRFEGGPLEGVDNRWAVHCPPDWAWKDDAGKVWRYRLRVADHVLKVATLELIPDA